MLTIGRAYPNHLPSPAEQPVAEVYVLSCTEPGRWQAKCRSIWSSAVSLPP